MNEYPLDNKIYIDLKDLRNEHKDFCKGTRSNNQLIERKQFKDYIFGRVDDEKLVATERLSRKYGSIFVNKEELNELFHKQETLLAAPPLIVDSDLSFFKDEDGNVYNVPMRGERTQDGIFFQVKGVMEVFKMANLQSNVQLSHTAYLNNQHYIWFKMSDPYNAHNQANKEMYLTYRGLIKVIETSRSGVGYKFQKWIDKVVFSAAFGTQEQKIDTFKTILNVDADHLKSIMSKSPTALSCLYLIDINLSDNGKRVFKYGFTKKVSRRFKEHMKRYGDTIKLDTFILLPELDLSKAESDFKNCISRYQYIKDGDDELISLCDEGFINIQNIFKSISKNYCGNVQEQIMIYEQMVKDLKHQMAMKDQEIENIKLHSKYEVSLVQSKLDLSLKDNEILHLKLHLAMQKK